jgi:hypothetical protein
LIFVCHALNHSRCGIGFNETGRNGGNDLVHFNLAIDAPYAGLVQSDDDGANVFRRRNGRRLRRKRKRRAFYRVGPGRSRRSAGRANLRLETLTITSVPGRALPDH